jgi:4-hydroxybenzoate polyprenyltransferase
MVIDDYMDNRLAGLSRLKLYLALSRTPHGLLDMCAPAFGALLWLGHFPSLYIIVLGMITTFAGYTAVYALNDVIDYEADKEKAAGGGLSNAQSDLDSMIVRHPMAQGLLSFKQGLFWSLAWGLVALVGAYILNPICVLIFLTGCSLETIYCMLWRVSPFRTVISGAVKTSGAIAAVFAVDPHPSGVYLIILFLLFFFWEIGGQNIPNDWVDCDDDCRIDAKTIPILWGFNVARGITLATIILTLCTSILLFYFSPANCGLFVITIALIIGAYLLLLPAVNLYKTVKPSDAMALFNKASYYPLALLILIVFKVL